MYTLELMYIWTMFCCYSGRSFRDTFTSEEFIIKSESVRNKFTNGEICPAQYNTARQRQHANDAFRSFLAVDVEKGPLGEMLFSCDK